MFCVWNAKGGAGCSVVSAGLSLLSSRQRPSLLVDLVGDLPAVLGVEVSGPGIVEWMEAPEPPPDALSRLEVQVRPGLALLPACLPAVADDPDDPGLDLGDPQWEQRLRLLLKVLASDDRFVVIDAGTGRHPCRFLFDAASRSILVTRSCYLSVRRAARGPCPDGIVVVREDGRALRNGEIEGAIRAPVLATVAWDPAVARAVDAGMLAKRLPRPLRPLRRLVDFGAAAV